MQGVWQTDKGLRVCRCPLIILSSFTSKQIHFHTNLIQLKMKKLFMLLAAFLTMMPTFAETDSDQDFDKMGQGESKKNVFSFGPKVGGTMTTMTQPDEGKLYDSPGFGFSAGLAFNFRFGQAYDGSAEGTGFFGVGAELKYKMNSVKTLGRDESGKENANLTIGYFDVPIYAHIYPFAKTRNMNSLYVELGVSMAGTLSRSPESLTVTNPSEDFSKVTYYLDTDDSRLKGFNVSPIVGLGYKIPNTHLDISARYYLGINKLAGNFNSKMSTAEISLAWYFDFPF